MVCYRAVPAHTELEEDLQGCQGVRVLAWPVGE
jgi:hypothetical protein